MAHKVQRIQLGTKQTALAIVVCTTIVYVSASWAIDSGKIVPYLLSFFSAYYLVYFSIELVKKKIHHDKRSITRTAKKAH
ncbi:MAG TPA: hypothetical protein PKD20_00260 [Candidatus Saccharibacteria bacterium]|nr:hypothetical protein [Candidatus Saccharibacteria bacterium]HMT55289.1 hypothetical protein [Candidatus Saccharibacteria bacterium]